MFGLQKGSTLKVITTGELYFRLFAATHLPAFSPLARIGVVDSVLPNIYTSTQVEYFHDLRLVNNTSGSIAVRIYIDNIPISSIISVPQNGFVIYEGDDIRAYDNTGTKVTTFITPTLTKVAAQAISAGMAVIVWTDGLAYKYNVNNPAHAGITCGIAKNGVGVGENVIIGLPGGIVTDSGSGWADGISYFIATNSLLTTIVPTSGISKKIATGVGIDTVLVNDYPEILLL